MSNGSFGLWSEPSQAQESTPVCLPDWVVGRRWDGRGEANSSQLNADDTEQHSELPLCDP